jgi:2-polyprenyl-3-methyl-5-hydroxy-6-metoxy-1,4-benzoquinol methylase
MSNEPMPNMQDENADTRTAWNQNARFWDQRMGDGNDFFETLVWPATEHLIDARPGERILDVACGNGLTSRRLAQAGAHVVAFDFSEEMISRARQRSKALQIDYRILDATDGAGLLALGERTFDAALCNMALMDIADIGPLIRALAILLCPGGRFVFSVMHPCFNNPASVQMGELEDQGGAFVTTYSVKVSRYQTIYTQPGLAMPGQPVPHLYFHRPMSALFGVGFKAGFVLDALEERAFPPENMGGTSPLSWNGHFSEIPPALIARMRTGM